ncbi:MAG: hypothetical protein V4687_04745 [Bacteroidota bacterium]
MQDRDFDQLFKDQFADAEITPPANLWGKIEKELEPKRRTILPVYWMAAAVAVVAVSIGVLVPKTEKIQLRGSADFVASTMTNTETAPKAEEATAKNAVTADRSEDSKSTPLVIAPRLNDEDVKKDFAAMQPIASNSHPVNIDAKVATVAIATVQEPVNSVNDVMIASVTTTEPSNVITEVEQPEHRGIRNVGDLVNLVVNKVDKREKKLIQFNTDDDDNSSLVGINLGFLKFGKRDK